MVGFGLGGWKSKSAGLGLGWDISDMLWFGLVWFGAWMASGVCLSGLFPWIMVPLDACRVGDGRGQVMGCCDGLALFYPLDGPLTEAGLGTEGSSSSPGLSG